MNLQASVTDQAIEHNRPNVLPEGHDREDFEDGDAQISQTALRHEHGKVIVEKQNDSLSHHGTEKK